MKLPPTAAMNSPPTAARGGNERVAPTSPPAAAARGSPGRSSDASPASTRDTSRAHSSASSSDIEPLPLPPMPPSTTIPSAAKPDRADGSPGYSLANGSAGAVGSGGGDVAASRSHWTVPLRDRRSHDADCEVDSGGGGGDGPPPPGSVFAENALLDSYSWHGIKSLYGCGLFFLVLFLAVWFQTEPGATAFKSSVISSFASYDSGQPWEVSTLSSADSTSDAFEYMVNYLGSVINRSSEVLPEAGSFVYLGDFAHITYAQLKISFVSTCSDAREPRERPAHIAALRSAAAPILASSWWARYVLGGAAQPPITQLPDTLPLAQPPPGPGFSSASGSGAHSGGPTRSGGASKPGPSPPPPPPRTESVSSGALSSSLLGLSDTCPDFSARPLDVDPAMSDLHDNVRNILFNDYYYALLSGFQVDYLSFLDLVGRLQRRPAHMQDLRSEDDDEDYAALQTNPNTTGVDDKGCTRGYVRRCVVMRDSPYSDACFCAHPATGLPRSLRAYLGPGADPRDGTAVLELVRLWPDFVDRASTDDMQEGLAYLLGSVRGVVGKYARELSLSLHAYDRRNNHSSVIFVMQATRDTDEGKLDTQTLTLTLPTRWRRTGLVFMGLAVLVAAADVALTLRAMALSCLQGRGVWGYVTGGVTWHPLTWHGLDVLHHAAIAGWVGMWVYLLLQPLGGSEGGEMPYPQSAEALSSAASRAGLFTSWLYYGLACFLLVGLRCFRYMKYHAGLRIFYTLFRLAFHDILEFATFVLGISVLLCATVFGIFIVSGGNSLFTAFGSGMGAMSRLSFGLLDYDAFVTDANGLGGNDNVVVVFFWVSVLLLVLVVQNTLLAIFTRAYETAKDDNASPNTIFLLTALYDLVFVAVRMRNLALVGVWALLTDPLGLCKYSRRGRRRVYWSAEYAAQYGVVADAGSGGINDTGEGVVRLCAGLRRALCGCGLVPAAVAARGGGGGDGEGGAPAADGARCPRPVAHPWLRRCALYLYDMPYRFRVYRLEVSCRDFELLAGSATERQQAARVPAVFSKSCDRDPSSSFSATMCRWRLASSPQLHALVAYFTDFAMERLNVLRVQEVAAVQQLQSCASTTSPRALSVRRTNTPPALPALPTLHEDGVSDAPSSCAPATAAAAGTSVPHSPFEHPNTAAAACGSFGGGSGSPSAAGRRHIRSHGSGGGTEPRPLAASGTGLSRVVNRCGSGLRGSGNGGSGNGGDWDCEEVEAADLDDAKAAYGMWRVRRGAAPLRLHGAGGGWSGGASADRGVGAEWGPVKLFSLPEVLASVSAESAQRGGGGGGPRLLDMVELLFFAETYESELAALFLAGPRALGLALEQQKRRAWRRLRDTVCCVGRGRRNRRCDAGGADGATSDGDEDSCDEGGKDVEVGAGSLPSPGREDRAGSGDGEACGLWRCLLAYPWRTLALCWRALLLSLWPNPFWPLLECSGLQDEDLKKLIRAVVAVYSAMPPHMTELQHRELRQMRERCDEVQEIKQLVRDSLKAQRGRRAPALPATGSAAGGGGLGRCGSSGDGSGSGCGGGNNSHRGTSAAEAPSAAPAAVTAVTTAETAAAVAMTAVGPTATQHVTLDAAALQRLVIGAVEAALRQRERERERNGAGSAV